MKRLTLFPMTVCARVRVSSARVVYSVKIQRKNLIKEEVYIKWSQVHIVVKFDKFNLRKM